MFLDGFRACDLGPALWLGKGMTQSDVRSVVVATLLEGEGFATFGFLLPSPLENGLPRFWHML